MEPKATESSWALEGSQWLIWFVHNDWSLKLNDGIFLDDFFKIIVLFEVFFDGYVAFISFDIRLFLLFDL